MKQEGERRSSLVVESKRTKDRWDFEGPLRLHVLSHHMLHALTREGLALFDRTITRFRRELAKMSSAEL